MLREQIKGDLAVAISNFQFPISNDEIEVTRTSDAKFGDYTTNIALKIRAKEPKEPKGPKVKKTSGSSGHSTLRDEPLGHSTVSSDRIGSDSKSSSVTSVYNHSPLEFARVLADSLKSLPYVEKLEVAGPGFINFFIKDEIWKKEVGEVLKLGDQFGANQIGSGKKARVEFVSANPTGPLHFGNARGGPIGDSLASVLEFCGYEVLREYYHNDIGGQVGKLGQSILNVVAGQSLENQEYKGEYVNEFANEVKAQIRAKMIPIGVTNVSLDWTRVGKEAVEKLLSYILADCELMGIKFDKVYPESKFIESGETKKALEKVRKYLKEKDGATWFAPSDEFLKDRETVVIKSDGSFTYFANDIAYHNLKFENKPDLVIDIFGANHHGHVPRLQAVIKALGYDVSKFYVILYQWVRFKRGREKVAMSKRAGTFVTAREVLDEVGLDAVRFYILMHDSNTHIDFDLELAKKKSKENPVYYVQYAHARIASILAKSNAERLTTNANYELLTTSYELDLIKQITRLPELAEDIAASFAVHRLTGYAIDLADSFHKFYENCRVIGESDQLELARLDLVKATKIALANTLKLLGISAPEKM